MRTIATPFICTTIVFLFVFMPLYSSGADWTTLADNTGDAYYGVWGSSSTDVFAVGGNGKILHYNGSAWTPMTTGTADTFTGVWGSSSTDVFATTSEGNIYYYNGSGSWSKVYTGSTYLFGVWGISSTDVFAVGANGLVLRNSSGSWQSSSSGANRNDRIWGSSNTDVFAVGVNGIRHYNGSWSSMYSTTYQLCGIYGTSGTNVFAVGEGGKCLHYNGEWTPIAGLPMAFYYGVWGTSVNNIYTVGSSGYAYHYDGSSWSPMDSGTVAELCDLWGSSDGNLFAVGVQSDASTSWTDHGIIIYRNCNNPPVANDDSTTMLEDGGAKTIDVRANDSDPESDPLTITAITQGTNGSVTNNSTDVSYTPNANFNGTDTFTYTINDGKGHTDTATVTVTVTAVNDVPSFTKGADQTVNEDAGAQTVNGWATALSKGPTNESGQTLTFNVTNNNNTLFSSQPAISASGNLTYTPAANANGSATVNVTLSDNGGTANGGIDTSAAQTFTITVNAVNDPPSFTKGADQTVNEDAGAQTVNGWATAISKGPADESSQTLTFNVSNDNNTLFSTQPAIDLSGNLTYTPAADANGTAVVTVSLSDNGGGSNTSGNQTFNITVNAVNDVPSFTKGADQTVNEDAGAQTVNGWATAISKGPANESGQTLTFNVTNNNNALFSSQPAISASGNLTYTPAANANGSATVNVTLKDDGGTANGGVDTSAAQTFTITVNAVNDPPSFTKGADQTVNEDAGAQTVNGWATAISKGPDDESSQTLTFNVSNDNNALFSTQPAIDPSGNLTYTPAADANGTAVVTVSLSDNGGGSNTSGNQTFNITVNVVNDVPSFTKGADQTVNEDAGAQTVNGWATAISKGPANESSQALTFNVTNNNNALFSSQPAISASGNLTYTPAADANGSATVNVTLSDNGGTANGGVDTSAAQTFTITVNAVNDVPSFTKGADQTVNEDAGAQTVNGWATAISKGSTNEAGQTLTFNLTTSNDALFSSIPAIDASGNLTYTPAANAHGSATVNVTLKDDGGTANGGVDTSAAQSFTITVNAVNDVPSFTKGADQTVNEDPGAQTVTGWATAISKGPANESGQTLTFNVTNNNNALFSSQPAISASGNLTYTPAANANGSATVNVTLSDDGGTANGGVDTSGAQTFTITVNAVNDPPSFSKGADQTVNEDAGAHTFNGWATAISKGPADESGQTLTFNVTNNNNALFSSQPAISASGNLTYTPAAEANGNATVNVTLSDDGGTANGGVDTSAAQTFTITVNAVNDVPIFTKGADQTVNEDAGAQTVTGWATAISKGPADESGQTLTFTVTNNNNALFSSQPAINPSGNLAYTPAANANGNATVNVTLKDDGGTANGGLDTSAAQTFTITVNSVNDVPSFTKGADQTVDEDAGAQTVNGWATAISKGPADESGQTLTFNITTTNDALFSAFPAIDASGNLTYTPAANTHGSATVNVTLKDDGGTVNGGVDTSAAQTFTITVNPEYTPTPTATPTQTSTPTPTPTETPWPAGKNRPPAIYVNDQVVSEGVTLTFTVQASDPDGDAVTLTATNIPSGASFEANVFTWTPGYDRAGYYPATFQADDGRGGITMRTISIRVDDHPEPTPTNTQRPVEIPTATPEPTATDTPLPIVIATTTPEPSPTDTQQPPTPTQTPEPTATAIPPTPVATDTPLPTATPVPPTATNTATSKPTPTAIPPTPTNTLRPTATATSQPIPTATATPEPTATPVPPTSTSTPTPTATATKISVPPSATPTPSPTVTSTPVPTSTPSSGEKPRILTVTDDENATGDLSGGVDTDWSSNRVLAIRWDFGLDPFLDTADIQDVHIYVRVDGGENFAYLGRTSSGTQPIFVWKTNGVSTSPVFGNGPEFGHDYQFQIFALTASGTPVFYGPYENGGPVRFTSTIRVTDNLNRIEDLSGGVDSDLSNNRSLVIRWDWSVDPFINAADILDIHIYVRVDEKGNYAYVGRTGSGASTFFEWKQRGHLLGLTFVDGPQFGHRYQFRIYALMASGSRRVYGPLENSAAISFESAVSVTDNAESLDDLSRGVDEDAESDRALAIRWNVDPEAIDMGAISDIHVYVEDNQSGHFAYLGRTGSNEATVLEWKPGVSSIAPSFRNGPQFGHRYKFRVFFLTISKTPKFYGPFENKGTVEYKQSGR